MKDEPPPSFATVASKIGAKWLEKVLGELADNVDAAINNAARNPLRFDVRADFQALRSAASKFEKVLNSVSERRLLLWPLDGIDQISAARKAIENITAACDKALISVPGGKGRARVPNPYPPKLVCALIVVEAWAAVNGKPPSANNENAQEVCDMYWRACGGSSDSKDWHRPLLAAQDGNKLRDYIRDEIQRNRP